MNIQKDYSLEHENKRKEMWIGAWICVASAWNCKDTDAATRWADAALEDFDARFPAPQNNLETSKPPNT